MPLWRRRVVGCTACESSTRPMPLSIGACQDHERASCGVSAGTPHAARAEARFSRGARSKHRASPPARSALVPGCGGRRGRPLREPGRMRKQTCCRRDRDAGVARSVRGVAPRVRRDVVPREHQRVVGGRDRRHDIPSGPAWTWVSPTWVARLGPFALREREAGANPASASAPPCTAAVGFCEHGHRGTVAKTAKVRTGPLFGKSDLY